MFCTLCCFFFSSRRRHTRCSRDWSSDVCSSDLEPCSIEIFQHPARLVDQLHVYASVTCRHSQGSPPEEVTELSKTSTRTDSTLPCGPFAPLSRSQDVLLGGETISGSDMDTNITIAITCRAPR